VPGSRVVIFDDGSTDSSYSDLAETVEDTYDLNITYVKWANNVGLCSAFQVAFRGLEAEWSATGIKEAEHFLSYVQDDVTFNYPNWLELCEKKYKEAVEYRRIGFISGHTAPEHAETDVPCPVDGCRFRTWIRATHMMAPVCYWKSMLPIPELAPDGMRRGHPSPNRGSGFDWHFVRDHELSVERTGRTNLIVEGLCTHIGDTERCSGGEPTPEL